MIFSKSGIINLIRQRLLKVVGAFIGAVVVGVVVSLIVTGVLPIFNSGSNPSDLTPMPGVVRSESKPCERDEQEPNNPPDENLTTLETGKCADRRIVKEDKDYYELPDIPNGAFTFVSVNVSDDESQPDVLQQIFRSSLFGPDSFSNLVTSEDCNSESHGDTWFGILTNNMSGGTYYLEVSGCLDTEYIYSVETESLRNRNTQDDGGSGGDAGDSIEEATCLTDGFEQGACPSIADGGTGWVGPRDPEDYYKFKANSSTVLKVTHEGYYELDIFYRHVDDDDETKIVTATGENDDNSKSAEIQFSGFSPGIYILRISHKLTDDEIHSYAVDVR